MFCFIDSLLSFLSFFLIYEKVFSFSSLALFDIVEEVFSDLFFDGVDSLPSLLSFCKEIELFSFDPISSVILLSSLFKERSCFLLKYFPLIFVYLLN